MPGLFIACLLVWLCGRWRRQMTAPVIEKAAHLAHPAADTQVAAQFRVDALKALLQNASDNYRENSKIMSALDDKAQKTIATAGIFLAATFAFMKPENIHSVAVNLNLDFLIFLLMTISTFILCVGACIWEMWLTTVPLPIPFKIFRKMTNDALSAERHLEAPVLEEAFSTEQIYFWEQTLDSQIVTNTKKAHRLLFAQCSLGCGILLVASILIKIVVAELISVPIL